MPGMVESLYAKFPVDSISEPLVTVNLCGGNI